MALQRRACSSRARRSSTICSAAASSGRTSIGARTRAYAMGLGQIYFNLRGREARGIVSPGAEARQLADELAARLLTMTDPDDGATIIRAVYKRDDIYSGSFLHNASELQVGMEDGYRVSWQTTLGGSPQGIVYANMKKWSGDHGGYDFATTAGVLITNVACEPHVAVDHGHRADGVQVSFGCRFQANIDGKPLFNNGSACVPDGRCVLADSADTRRVRSAPLARATPQTPAKRAAERIRALQREAEALVAQESQLLVELRKLELERQIKVEELTAIEREAARPRASSTMRPSAHRRAATHRRADGLTSRRGWCSSTSLAAPATGGCCSTSTICDRSAAPTAPPRR